MAFPTSPTDGQTYKNYVYNGSEGIWRYFYRTEVLDQALPIGMMYVQFPGQLDPAQMSWPGTWNDVTSDYAGAFFRAEGSTPYDSAKAFEGGAQDDQMQQITGGFRSYARISSVSGAFSVTGTAGENPPGSGDSSTVAFNSANSPNARTGSETRPYNYTIRIFKRVS